MTTPDHIESEVADALAKVRRLESEQTRVAAAVEQADASYERELGRLRGEFGVSTPAEARELLTSIEAELRAELDKVNSALADAEPEEG